jgi:thymidylate kinase
MDMTNKVNKAPLPEVGDLIELKQDYLINYDASNLVFYDFDSLDKNGNAIPMRFSEFDLTRWELRILEAIKYYWFDKASGSVLISFEGGDATGKGTLTKLLVEKLTAHLGIRTTCITTTDLFEKTDKNEHVVNFVKSFLGGDFGNPYNIHPAIKLAVFSALRHVNKERYTKALADNDVVICDRYTASFAYNFVGNTDLYHDILVDKKEALARLMWDLENDVYQMPLVDAVFLVESSMELVKDNLRQRADEGTIDSNEKSIDQMRLRESYRELLPRIMPVPIIPLKTYAYDESSESQILQLTVTESEILFLVKFLGFLKSKFD